jgi:hypothetical protein
MKHQLDTIDFSLKWRHLNFRKKTEANLLRDWPSELTTLLSGLSPLSLVGYMSEVASLIQLFVASSTPRTISHMSRVTRSTALPSALTDLIWEAVIASLVQYRAVLEDASQDVALHTSPASARGARLTNGISRRAT